MRRPFAGLTEPLRRLRETSRDPRNDAPVPYSGPGVTSLFSAFTANGMDSERYLRATGAVGTLFSIVDRTSTSTAAVEWGLFRRPSNGRATEDRVEVLDHLALRLWNKPNPWMTRQEFVQVQQQHVDLTGEGWWAVVRIGNVPMELWPLRPDLVEVVPHSRQFITGYVYHAPGGAKVPFLPNEMIMLRNPCPWDPYRGMGPVQSIIADLDGIRLSAQYNRNFFLNSAQPGGVVEIPADSAISDAEFRRLRAQLDEQHKGVGNAHRTLLLEGGASWHDASISQRDMQFVELRGVSRDAVREAYGMPKFALGDVTDVNRASANASRAWFAEELTVPRAERFKLALNHDLLPMFGSTGGSVEFDYVSPVPDDEEAENATLVARTGAFKTLIDCGVDPIDAAQVCELPPMRVTVRAPLALPAAPAPAAPEPANNRRGT